MRKPGDLRIAVCCLCFFFFLGKKDLTNFFSFWKKSKAEKGNIEEVEKLLLEGDPEDSDEDNKTALLYVKDF